MKRLATEPFLGLKMISINIENNALITPDLAPGNFVYLVDMMDSDGELFDVGPDNPAGIKGMVTGWDHDFPGRVIVTWLNGHSNSYLPQNLIEANAKQFNK